MIDLQGNRLSEGIKLIGEEINRGLWLLETQGITVRMPQQVEVTMDVSVNQGDLIIDSIKIDERGEAVTTQLDETSDIGAEESTSNETGTSQDQQTTQVNSVQSGKNTSTDDYTHEPDTA
jgi:hypothetical protein